MEIKLPVDLAAEAIILGRMLGSIDVVNDVFDNLKDSDFYAPEHRAIFQAMHQLFKSEAVIEPTSVCHIWRQLDQKGVDEALVWGLEVYRSCYADDASLYISIVKAKSLARKLIAHGQELISMAASENLSSGELQSEISKKQDQIFNDAAEDSLHQIGQSFTQSFRDSGLDYIAYHEKKKEDFLMGISSLSGFSTGFFKLDSILDGINKGHFIIVGARPGVGKTTFILNLIKNMLEENTRIGFFSLEATLSDIQDSILGVIAGVEKGRWKVGDFTSLDIEKMRSAVKSLEDKCFVIDDRGCVKVSQVLAKTKRMIANHKIDILFVDYLGEIKGDGKFLNKQEEMQTVSRGLRGIAKSMNIPIVCVCQLNRESEKLNRVPKKSDLRETGQIEADAHSILLLHRPDQVDENNHPGILNVHIVKNRYGAEGKISYNFNKNTGKMSELDKFVNDIAEDEKKSKQSQDDFDKCFGGG